MAADQCTITVHLRRRSRLEIITRLPMIWWGHYRLMRKWMGRAHSVWYALRFAWLAVEIAK